jgi:HEPN domain-containing protein
MDDKLRQEAIEYWLNSANHDFETAEKMLLYGHYDWCLFVGQLSLEKILKGLIVKNNHHQAPFIHNLKKLAELNNIDLNQTQAEQLIKISQFNLEARYAEVNLSFYKTATKEFSTNWFAVIREFYLWFKSLY